MTLEMSQAAEERVGLVRRRCAELDEEHGLELVKDFEAALEYAAKFGDQDLEGKSVNRLCTDTGLQEGEELGAQHFSFVVYATRPGQDSAWFTLGMIYHNGSGMRDGTFSVEVNASDGPHWSFHS